MKREAGLPREKPSEESNRGVADSGAESKGKK